MKIKKEQDPATGNGQDLAKHGAALLSAIEQEPVPPAIEDLARKLQAAIDKRRRSDAD